MIKEIVMNKFIMVFILVLCTAYGLFASGSGELVQGSEMVVKVAYVQGSATIDGMAARTGQIVTNKARITTAADGNIELIFNQRNVIRIAPNSLVILDFNATSREIDLQKGAATSVLKKLEKIGNNDAFTLKTPLATAGVRGTSFCVWVSQDSSETYICACNGSVQTIDAAGANEELLEAAHHVARIYSKTPDGISKVPGGLLHHDDASVQEVADRIGYLIDWDHID